MQQRLLQLLQPLVLMCLTVSTTAYAEQQIGIVEGDIFVDTRVQSGQRPGARSISLADNSQLWPEGIIAYTLDPALGAFSMRAIDEAIAYWNDVGAITLVPFEEAQGSSENVIEDYVRFTVGEFCASWVGRRGGEQDLWVAPHCLAGSVMHEIGHLIGLEHEHTRPDRGQYITIHWDNIIEDKKHNFDVAPSGSRLLGAYDYDSIMHYGPNNFSSNGLPTLSAIDGQEHTIGQRKAPSTGDLFAVEQLYASDLSVTVRSEQRQPSTRLDVYVSNESDQGAHGVLLKVETGAQLDAIHTPLTDNWTCNIDDNSNMVSCSLASLAGSAVEHLVVPLPADVDLEAVSVSVSSKTPDSDLTDNTSGVEVPVQGEAAVQPDDVSSVELPPVGGSLRQDAVASVARSGGSVNLYSLVLLLIWCCRCIQWKRHKSQNFSTV